MEDLISKINEQNSIYQGQFNVKKEQQRVLEEQKKQQELAEKQRLAEQKKQAQIKKRQEKKQEIVAKIKKSFGLIAIASAKAVKTLTNIKPYLEEKRVQREQAKQQKIERQNPRFYWTLKQYGTKPVGTVEYKRDIDMTYYDWAEVKSGYYPHADQKITYTAYGPVVHTYGPTDEMSVTINGGGPSSGDEHYYYISKINHYSGFVNVPGNDNNPDRILFVEAVETRYVNDTTTANDVPFELRGKIDRQVRITDINGKDVEPDLNINYYCLIKNAFNESQQIKSNTDGRNC